MTTGLGNRGNNCSDATVRDRMVSIGSYGAGILIILFMGNLSALIDVVIHPEIHYFDEEHLIVGGATAFVTTVLFIMVMKFLSKSRRQENELREFNAELEKKVEERSRQLVEVQGELLQVEKLAMLGRIAGSMGNELRNPLGVMSNAVFFLRNVLPDSDGTFREYLEIIGAEIDKAQAIISDLLDFCSGRSPRTEPVAAHELIHKSLERCAIPENIHFQADLPETLPWVLVDPLQVGKVFRNLIDNAVQAMPDGGALRISARFVGAGLAPAQAGYPQKSPLQDFLEISVIDTGEGITPENLRKLFQPLFTTKSRGIGLGLAISRKLTEANGGRIEVESVLGKGTTFMVLLPLVPCNS